MESIWMESAKKLLEQRGYLEARLMIIKHRDMNSPGTPSFAFHNATLKCLEALREVAA